MLTTETATNKATFQRLHDAVSSRDMAVIARTIDEIVDPDVLFHTPVPLEVSGVEALKHVWTVLLRAYPDIHVAVQDMIVEGDKVVSRNIVTGTHQGEYRGLAATGRSVTYNEIFIGRFAGGRIVELWGVVDVYTQLRQLGVAF